MPLTKSPRRFGRWVFLVVCCMVAVGYSAEAERDGVGVSDTRDAQRNRALRIARDHLDTKILGTRGGSSKWALDAKRKGNGWVVSIPEDVVRTMPGGFPQWLLVDVDKNAAVVYSPEAEAAGQNALRHLVVSLQIEPAILRIGDRVTIEARVANEGKKPVRLVRLRASRLERCTGLFGWSISIEGSDGRYTFIPVPGPAIPMRDDDVIELLPGESFGVKVDLAHAVLVKGKPPYKRLARTEGKYRVRVTYKSHKAVLGPYMKTKVQDVFLGPISSDILGLEIRRSE